MPLPNDNSNEYFSIEDVENFLFSEQDMQLMSPYYGEYLEANKQEIIAYNVQQNDFSFATQDLSESSLLHSPYSGLIDDQKNLDSENTVDNMEINLIHYNYSLDDITGSPHNSLKEQLSTNKRKSSFLHEEIEASQPRTKKRKTWEFYSRRCTCFC